MFVSNPFTTFASSAKVVLAAFTLIALVGCDGEVKLTASSDGSSNIVETAENAGTFNTLLTALRTTGLDTVLADESTEFTVFAPTDDAFAALGSDAINDLIANPEQLKDILLYHVISGSAVGSQAAIDLAGGTVTAANGSDLNLSLQDGALFINSSQVTSADVTASNGVIHVIDAVLIPGQADDTSQADNTSSDDGQDGGEESSNEAPVIEQPGNPHNLDDIVTTAVAAGSFNTLAAALQATGLDTVLADEAKDYTVFAPTDAAFAALGEDTINALLADPEALRDILLYHVVGNSSVDAQTAVGLAGTKVTAANGDEFALSLNDGMLYVNLSQVTATDIFASNGVIHVIDTVLIPPAPIMVSGSIVDVAVSDGRFTTLVAALQATQLDTVLADHSGVFTVFAPTDDAFALLGSDTINALLSDLPTLKNILLTHVIGGSTIDSVSAYAATGGTVTTASGADIALSIRDGALFVNDSKVIITDIRAENGIIHVIDSVIH